MSFASFRPVAALVASAVLGGVVAVGAVALLGGLDGGTTVVTETSAAPQPSACASGRRRDERQRDLRARRVGRRACQLDEQLDSPQRAPRSPQQSSALGSGFVIDKTGHIVTNYHVVEGADEVTVSFSNRDTVKAEVVGTDPSTRPRGAARGHRGERAHATSARQLRRGRGRRPGRRDRQSRSASTAP